MSVRARRPALLALAAALVAGATLAGPVVPVVAAPPSPDPVIAAVGDVACQSFSQSDGEGACRSDEVAALITDLAPDRFLALGDLQYNNGTLDEFLRVWDPQFGHLRSITMPTPGNHEYGTEGAQGYFDYFGPVANGPRGYYSFDLGAMAHRVAELRHLPRRSGLRSGHCAVRMACRGIWQRTTTPRAPSRSSTTRRSTGGSGRSSSTRTTPARTPASENEMYFDMWRLMDGARRRRDARRPQPHLPSLGPAGRRTACATRTASASSRSARAVGRSTRLGKKPRPANLLAVQNKAFGVLQMTLHEDSYSYAWVGLPTDPAFRDQRARSRAAESVERRQAAISARHRNARSSTSRVLRFRSSASSARAASTPARPARRPDHRKFVARRQVGVQQLVAPRPDLRGDPVAQQRRDREQHPVDVVALCSALATLEPDLDTADRAPVDVLRPPLRVEERGELLARGRPSSLSCTPTPPRAPTRQPRARRRDLESPGRAPRSPRRGTRARRRSPRAAGPGRGCRR